jgi:hypothetical protein
LGQQAQNAGLYLPRDAAAINADTACEALSVAYANINNDGTDDYALFVLGAGECGAQNCPLFFVISEGASFRTLDTFISASPDSLQWLAPKGQGKENTPFFFASATDKCRTVWTWNGDSIATSQPPGTKPTCPQY